MNPPEDLDFGPHRGELLALLKRLSTLSPTQVCETDVAPYVVTPVMRKAQNKACLLGRDEALSWIRSAADDLAAQVLGPDVYAPVLAAIGVLAKDLISPEEYAELMQGWDAMIARTP